jgi:hypothetical protein
MPLAGIVTWKVTVPSAPTWPEPSSTGEECSETSTKEAGAKPVATTSTFWPNSAEAGWGPAKAMVAPPVGVGTDAGAAGAVIVTACDGSDGVDPVSAVAVTTNCTGPTGRPVMMQNVAVVTQSAWSLPAAVTV